MADELMEMDGDAFDGELFDEAQKSTGAAAKYMPNVITNLSNEKAVSAAYVANALGVEKKNIQGCLNMLVKQELAMVREHKETKIRFYRLNQTQEETVELREKIFKNKEATKVSEL